MREMVSAAPPALGAGGTQTDAGGPEGDGAGERFTERAKKVMVLAQEEAQGFYHNYIGTEHLLLGLVESGGAARVHPDGAGRGARADTQAVEYVIGRGDRKVTGAISLTPRAKKVVELAHDEAQRLNHNHIGTEHLLLGLVVEGEGIATGVLESLGATLENVRAQVIRVVTLHRVRADDSPQPRGTTSSPAGSTTATWPRSTRCWRRGYAPPAARRPPG